MDRDRERYIKRERVFLKVKSRSFNNYVIWDALELKRWPRYTFRIAQALGAKVHDLHGRTRIDLPFSSN